MAATYPVYVVDDDPHFRSLAQIICEHEQMESRAFENGEMFLDALDDLGPGCVLLDMRMPLKTGLQVQAELAERGRALPVVAITGHGDAQMAVESMRLGAVDFLEKPMDIGLLVEAIRRGLGRLEKQTA